MYFIQLEHFFPRLFNYTIYYYTILRVRNSSYAYMLMHAPKPRPPQNKTTARGAREAKTVSSACASSVFCRMPSQMQIVSGEGQASIVKAYSRLILVDGLVL